jgi:arylsulfate sulfotransferase
MTTDGLPPIRLAHCDAARREAGLMLFNVRTRGESINGHSGWLMRLDRDGAVGCIHKSDRAVQGVRHLPNGHLLVTIGDGLVCEMTLEGETLRQWYATGRSRDRKPPPGGGIPVATETFHHGVNLGPDGHLLLLSMEVRRYDDWPGSTTDPQASRGPADVVGDIVVEVAPDGTVVNEWRLLDLLDPQRIGYGSRDAYWVKRGYPDTQDWCHANGTAYDSRDDSILVSLRTQDCIVKFSRRSGELRWILGSHANWRAPWADKLLRPEGSLSWNFHQHDCSITPAGTILCFDNGNNRALPFERRIGDEANTSRAVEFAVDEKAMTLRQVWSCGDAPGTRLFAGFQGGAFRFPNGNTFITYGGICSTDGKPNADSDRADIRARLTEVTPANEVVLDLRVGGEPGDPRALSVFRSEWVRP